MTVDFNTVGLTPTEESELESELYVISTTKKGTIPLLRDLGSDVVLPEDNNPISKNQYASDLIEQVNEWEDRVQVSEVIFEDDNEVRVVIENG